MTLSTSSLPTPWNTRMLDVLDRHLGCTREEWADMSKELVQAPQEVFAYFVQNMSIDTPNFGWVNLYMASMLYGAPMQSRLIDERMTHPKVVEWANMARMEATMVGAGTWMQQDAAWWIAWAPWIAEQGQGIKMLRGLITKKNLESATLLYQELSEHDKEEVVRLSPGMDVGDTQIWQWYKNNTGLGQHKEGMTAALLQLRFCNQDQVFDHVRQDIAEWDKELLLNTWKETDKSTQGFPLALLEPCLTDQDLKWWLERLHPHVATNPSIQERLGNIELKATLLAELAPTAPSLKRQM